MQTKSLPHHHLDYDEKNDPDGFPMNFKIRRSTGEKLESGAFDQIVITRIVAKFGEKRVNPKV